MKNKATFVVLVDGVIQGEEEGVLAVESVYPPDEFMPAPILASAVEAVEYGLDRVLQEGREARDVVRLAREYLHYFWAGIRKKGVAVEVIVLTTKNLGLDTPAVKLPEKKPIPEPRRRRNQDKQLAMFRRVAALKYAQLREKLGKPADQIYV